MTRTEIADLARECQLPYHWRTGEVMNLDQLVKFAQNILARKEWQGLTKEEVVSVFNKVATERHAYPETRFRDFAQYIEAKLKEKNL